MNFLSFDDFLETMKRGNEVQFKLKNDIYGIFPHWENGIIIGYYIGKLYQDNDLICIDITSLKNYEIQGKKLSDIFEEIEIIDRII